MRLLRLLPHSDENSRVECQLVTCSLLDSGRTHPYEALSYRWESEETPQSVHIGDDKLPIGENLHKALIQLRDSFVERILWIDAICINQKEDNESDEKGQQVQAMAKIYAKASRVIVWLGEAANNSDEALEAIRAAAENQRVDTLMGAVSQQAILTLLGRDWFQRIWVSGTQSRI